MKRALEKVGLRVIGDNKVGSNTRRRAGSITLSDHRENAGGAIASGGNVSRTTPTTLISPTYGRSTGLVGRFGL